MSNEGGKSDLTRSPSTSGSSRNNWNCSNTDDSNIQQHINGHNKSQVEGYIPDLVLNHPMMSINNVSSNYNINYYQANNFYYMGNYFQGDINKRYCRTDKEEYQIRNAEPRHGSISQKQSSGRLLLLTIIIFFTCVSYAMGNDNEEKNNDQRLLSLRKWENVNDGNRSNRPGFIFTVMSYNVLSQDLLMQHPYLYTRHNNASLQWTVRWNNIFYEISKFKPDILCLQEVQESHIPKYFSILESIGYSSLYKRRTGERTDGCAIYFKTDVIKLVEHTSVEYLQPNITLLNRDNVGLIAKFSPKLHPTREFVVATTHLLYNPRRQDVRLAQMQLLLTEIERLSYSTIAEGNYVPVILTGDLNSTPDSSVYEFISKGKLKYEDLSPRYLKKGTNSTTGKFLVPPELRITDNCQHADLLEKRLKNEQVSRSEEVSLIELFHSERGNEKQSKKNEADAKLFATGTLSHNFVFKSVYNHEGEENNKGTTFQDEWLTVDYIFYSTKKDTNSEDKLRLLSKYRLPSKEELIGINIPNSMLGSDHLSLLAKFKLEY